MKLILLNDAFVWSCSFGIHFRNLFLSAPSFNSEYMSRNLLQWLKRTRMEEGMIWNTYFKHRRQELRERFPQCGKRGTNANHLTVLQFRSIIGKGVNYYYVNSIYGDTMEISTPVDAKNIPDDYYVKAIRFEFPKDSEERYMINCYCCEWEYHDPVIELPDFHFRMSIKYWWAVEIRDFIEHVNKFFPQWREEVQLIEHEVPKIEKLRRMRQIRSERMRLRTFEPFIESCHQGLCEIKEGRLYVIVPLSNGRDLSIEMPVQTHNQDWWEKIQAMVSAIVELFETQIAENRFNWSPHLREVICTSRTCGYWGFDSWRYKWIRREDLEGLFRKKKTWRKYMPITVKMV